MSIPKLVVFDINDTLVEDNTFLALNMALGMTKAEDKMFYELNQEGVMPNDMWVELVNNIYQKRGKATKKNIEAAILNYTYLDGAKQCIAKLQKAHVKIALLSGSVDLFVKKVADELDVSLWRSSAQLHFNKNGTLTRMDYLDEDETAKLHNLKDICDIEGIDIRDVVCIGDGSNDRALFKQTRGITFTGSKIANIAWKVVPSIKDVPDAILNFGRTNN